MKVLNQLISFLSATIVLAACSLGAAKASTDYVAQAETDIASAQISTLSQAQSKYPFVGKLFFDFVGANATMQAITITPNGYTVIEGQAGNSSYVIYEGTYSQMMSGFDGEIYYSVIGKNAIAQLDSTGNLMYGDDCNILEGKPCVTKLFQAD